MKKTNLKNTKGQALILLLVFTTVGIITASSAIAISIINSQSANQFEQGQYALSLAETGVENAIIRLLRNPTYSGEVLNIDTSSVTVTVTGAATKTIVAKSQDGNLVRTVQVVGNLTNTFSITSWQEID